MARIPTYQKDTNISDNDFILGSDGDNNELATKNFYLGAIAEFAIDKLIDPDATQSQIPVFKNAVGSQGGNATRITSSIMTQDAYPSGNLISIAGNLSVQGNGTIGNDLQVDNELKALTLQVDANATISGFLTMEDEIDMSTNRIIDIGDPINPQDAATKAYVDALDQGDVTGSGTTNTLPLWSDGANGVLADSGIQYDPNNGGYYQITNVGANNINYNFLPQEFSSSTFSFKSNGLNGGYYQNNFRFEGNLGVGRSGDPQAASLDVGVPSNNFPAARFFNGVVISNNPGGVQVDNTSMVIGAGNNDIINGCDHSMAIGNGNQIQTNSDNTVAIGTSNSLSGAKNSLVVGLGNTISLSSPGHSIVQGQNNTLTNSFSSFVAGGNNAVNVGQNAFVLGYSHELTGADSFIVLGENNVSQGSTNDNNVYMIGGNLHGKDGTMVLGFRNDEPSYPAIDYSKGLGNTKFVIGVGTVDDTNAMIITEGGVTRGGSGVSQVPRILLPTVPTFSASNDAAADAIGVPTGGLYQNNGVIQINQGGGSTTDPLSGGGASTLNTEGDMATTGSVDLATESLLFDGTNGIIAYAGAGGVANKIEIDGGNLVPRNGTLGMIAGYAPSNDEDIATKLYVDNKQTTGTYTPQLIAATPSEWVISSYNIRQGKWVRIGNMVFCDFTIIINAGNISGNTGGTSGLTIQGWPYDHDGGAGSFQGGALNQCDGFDVEAKGSNVTLNSGLGNAKLNITKQNTAITTYFQTTSLKTGDFNNGNQVNIKGSFSYLTTDSATLNSGATIDS